MANKQLEATHQHLQNHSTCKDARGGSQRAPPIFGKGPGASTRPLEGKHNLRSAVNTFLEPAAQGWETMTELRDEIGRQPAIMASERSVKAGTGAGREKRVDIHAVAARARVSIATVSRTMNKVPTVDQAMVKRVWKAIEELGYTPNTLARALPSGRTRLIGLIVSEITNPFFPELIQAFEAAVVERGYELLIGSTNYDPKTMEQCVRRMIDRNVEGVAVMTFGIEPAELVRFSDRNIPLVCIDNKPEGVESLVLEVDYRCGIHEAVQHLAVLGHRRIAFISGPEQLFSARARREAFLSALQTIGIAPDSTLLVAGDHTLEGGRDAMRGLLKLDSLPTAVVCSNDMTAIGVQHTLFECKLRVPDELSLIGYDDIHLAEYTIPPLTTIRMSGNDLAQTAIRGLMKRLALNTKPNLATSEVAAEPLRIGTRLIVRQTTGLPRRALEDLRALH